ncbi:hypothetical protein K435DRAFT_29410 [Dendrothele bispora CBS 962.96]|uniref:DUF6534 domain-containing protein n=1 Tax=Dendrothele bispora (strain CBS 962.96) TaxID=1314807 RepID=A0A4V6T4Y4_DENBC|nr:hypothetical protein K435DRAFT_29410 [Dendrothele bispora CBS 962.96]
MLLGSLIVQLYNYCLTCSKDRKLIKFTVFFLFICDLVQTGLATDYSWKTLVSFRSHPTSLSQIPDTATVSLVIISTVVAGIVQFFFAWRIWHLSAEQKWFRVFPILIILVALMQVISALVVAIHFIAGGSHVELLPPMTPGLTVWLVGSFIADILIVLCMVYLLRCAKNQSFSKRTESILSKLVANSIHTGAITAIVAGIELALFLHYEITSNFYQAPAFLLGKLYSNVLLANLNARARYKQIGMGGRSNQTMPDNSYNLSEFRVADGLRMQHHDKDVETGAVHICTEVIADDDYQIPSKPGNNTL